MSSNPLAASSVVSLDLVRRTANMGRMSNESSSMGVIFDLDGVLVDTGWAHKQSWFELAADDFVKLPASQSP